MSAILKSIQTLGPPGKRRLFSYSGSVALGVVLEQSGKPRIDAEFFSKALHDFSGKTVFGGFREDDPPPNGFGAWVEKNSVEWNSRKLTPRHGSFMAAILCAEAGVRNGLVGNSIVLTFP